MLIYYTFFPFLSNIICDFFVKISKTYGQDGIFLLELEYIKKEKAV